MDWPLWLQVLVTVPHVGLIFWLLLLWRPKTRKGWLWYAGLAIYAAAYLLVMHFEFGM